MDLITTHIGEHEEHDERRMSVKKRAVATHRALLYGGSASAIGMGFYYVMQIAKQRPDAAIQMIGTWGPLFIIVVMLIWIGDRRVGELINVNQRGAVAYEHVARALQHMSDKDDREAEFNRRMISTIGSQQEKLLESNMQMMQGMTRLTSALTQCPVNVAKAAEGV